MKTFKEYLQENTAAELKVGDSVWVKHPTQRYKTLTGVVTGISKKEISIKHKDGSSSTANHRDVSKDFEELNPNPYKK